MAPGRTTPKIWFFCLIALKLHFEMSDSPRHFLIIWYLSWDVRTCQKSVTPHRASFHDTQKWQKWHWPQVLSSTLERISGDNSGITRNATTLASRVTLRGAQMHPQLSVTRTCQAFIPHSLAFTPNLICCFDDKLFWHPHFHLQLCFDDTDVSNIHVQKGLTSSFWILRRHVINVKKTAKNHAKM